VKCELETLKLKEKELVEELNTYKDKVDLHFLFLLYMVAGE